MVEFAIVTPLVALFVFGLIELGMAWRDTLTVNTAARSGARIASNLGNERLSDWETISAVQAALADIDGTDIQAVIIYDAAATDGQIPTECLTSGGNSVAGKCNYYSPAQLQTLVEADFTTAGSSCDTSSPDHYWCPLDRSTTQGTLDHVGVYIRVEYDSQTDILPWQSLTIDDSAVMRIEPRLETSI
ncbi:MAG: pilus assembly protein [Acidimicrobiia bacterium]|nr:pilus assembly protein [Acidimicrobiia bacterium]